MLLIACLHNLPLYSATLFCGDYKPKPSSPRKTYQTMLGLNFQDISLRFYEISENEDFRRRSWLITLQVPYSKFSTMSKQFVNQGGKYPDIPPRPRSNNNASQDKDELSLWLNANILKLPEGFKQLLQNLSSKVLKERPKNILRFSAAHFNRLLERRDKDKVDLKKQIVNSAAHQKVTEEVIQPVNVDEEEASPAVDPSDRDAAKAATLIQANYRGYKTRQSLTPNKAPEKDPSRKEAIIDALLDTLQDDDSMTVESDDQIKSTESEKGQIKKDSSPTTLVDLQEVTATGFTILASLRIPRPKNSGENQKK
ncbi:uncharacterized protein LOC143447390 isoform X2 [Clavelina lepadiformis]|uniref:uncharacterized protein LOC143447390 isoform X2 n=1 Tax=Clavelina lepadiformis TaxID=159417 RepID=UPI00404264F3